MWAPLSMQTTPEPLTAVQLKDVSKRFEETTVALDRATFSADFGSITGIIGANGSGKTTLLKLIAGLLKPDDGVVATLGLKPDSATSTLRAQISYISQQKALDPEMTVRETLLMFCSLFGIHGTDQTRTASKVGALFELNKAGNKKVADLSGGYRQRLHLACGLLHPARLILADEPSSALDPQFRSRLWALLCELSEQGVAVIVISHDLVQVEQYCNQLIMLRDGQIVAHDSPKNLIEMHHEMLFEASLLKPLTDEQRTALDSHDIVSEQHGKLYALLSDQKPEHILKIIEPIKSYRCEQASLSTVYLKLSGQALISGRNRPNHSRRKRAQA